MRVLHVLPTRAVEYGGPVTVAGEIVGALRRQGIDASIYPLRDDTSDGKRRLFAEAANAWRNVEDAVSGCDLLHIHGLWNIPATLAAQDARKRGIPYVITTHGMLDRWSLAKSRSKKTVFSLLFERKNLAHAAGLHFLNVEEMEEARDYGLTAPCFIVPNGVRADQFASLPPRSAFEVHYPQCRGKILALFLGRLHPKKGFDLLLPAITRAAAVVPELHLLIAGPDEGGYKNVLLEMVPRNNLGERVTFTGMVQGNTKLEALGAADLFVLPSHQEGDSIAVKEAMASGLPVIITSACHFPEVMAFNAGLVVRPCEGELCNALKSLATRPDERKRMGDNAARLIADRYTWTKITERLVQVYDDVVAGKMTSCDWKV